MCREKQSYWCSNKVNSNLSWNKDLLKYKRSTYFPQHALQKEKKIVTKWLRFWKAKFSRGICDNHWPFKLIPILENNCKCQIVRLVSLFFYFYWNNVWDLNPGSINEVLDMRLSYWKNSLCIPSVTGVSPVPCYWERLWALMGKRRNLFVPKLKTQTSFHTQKSFHL